MMKWLHKNLVTAVALFAYLMMSLMLIAQARVIDNQRTLIRQLFSDNVELTARKLQDLKTQHR